MKHNDRLLQVIYTSHPISLSAYEISMILNWYETSVGIPIKDSLHSESKDLFNRLQGILDSIMKEDYNAENISRKSRKV